MCGYRPTPIPVTLVSLSLGSRLSGRGPSRHKKTAENRAVAMAVRVCFNQNKSQPAAGGSSTLIASPATLPDELDLGQDHRHGGSRCPRVASSDRSSAGCY